MSDDEEAAEKKLAQARQRREALMKKHKEEAEAKAASEQPGENSQNATADMDSAKNGNAVAAKPAEKPAETPKAADAPAQSPANTRSKAGETKKSAADDEGGGGNMFDERKEAGEELKKGMAHKSQNIGLTGASGEDWDDDEGYYIPKIGEVMDGRYLVVETASGKGVFSNVVKAKDQQDPALADALVAVKILRANDMMTKQAEKEVEILERLSAADKHGKKHVVRLLNTFAYRRHFCLVFECMHDDLRAALRKHTKNKGMTLPSIRSYTLQLFIGLRHMHNHKIIHADIKPDNVLISKGHNVVKFCDLGTAVELKDVFVSPYLASRFYRAPEITLGCEYTQAVDTWALACTLFECFTGKVLFNSKTNNDHLRKVMEIRGKIPVKVIKKGAVWKTHFTDECDFKHVVEDKGPLGTGQPITKTLTDLKATNNIKDLIFDRVGPEKRQSTVKEDMDYVKRAGQFSDLLEHMLSLDPDKRIQPDDALRHPFMQDWPGEGSKAAAPGGTAVERSKAAKAAKPAK